MSCVFSRSSSFNLPGARLLVAGVVAFALFASAGLLLGADRSEAAFTSGVCQGADTGGAGATFQNGAHQATFIFAFSGYCQNLGVGSPPAVTYLGDGTGSGSGCGLTYAGAYRNCADGLVNNTNSGTGNSGASGGYSRTQNGRTYRFFGTDDPPTETDVTQINAGTATVGDEGQIRTIPVALGSIAVIINIPAGCTITRTPGVGPATPPASNELPTVVGATSTASGFGTTDQARFQDFSDSTRVRLRLTRSEIEKIFAGDPSLDTWGELVPWINDGDGTGALPIGAGASYGDAWCQGYPITRVRRQDNSGTTYAFKDFLGSVRATASTGNPIGTNPDGTSGGAAGNWMGSTFNGTNNRQWPRGATTTSFDWDRSKASVSPVDITGDAVAIASTGAGRCASSTSSATAGTYSPAAGAGGANPNAAGLGCLETNIPTLQTEGTNAPGNSGVIDKVANWEGAIGYAVLGDLRSVAGGTFQRTGDPTDDKYWVPVQRADSTTLPNVSASTTYDDPNKFAAGIGNSTRGSSCDAATVRNLPPGDDPTLGVWGATTTPARDAATAVSSTTGYGICSLTYVLAWDDYSKPYPTFDQALEERRARTVKDYLTAALSAPVQNSLYGSDYAPVPTNGNLQGIAREAVAKITFGPPATGGGGTGGGGTGGGGTGGGGTGGGGGGGTTPPPVPAKPSNAFTAAQPRVQKGKILVTVQVPGAGSVRASATARLKGKTIALGSGTSTRSSGGAVSLRLTPSAAAKKALRRAALNATVSITFTPNGGEGKTETRTIRLKKGKY